MSRKKLIILISAGVVLVVLVVLGIVFFAKGKKSTDGAVAAVTSQSDSKRQNTLKLIERYIEQGEFDRALDLIDKLLIDNMDDEDAKELQRQVFQSDRHKDSDSLTEMQKQMLEEQRRQNERLAANLQRAASSGLASGESEAAAERRAAAEAEAARKKAQEEELAKASRQMQEQMRKVNELVADAKAKLNSGDLPGADRLFSDARKSMPENEPRFESQKLADMADAYYEFNSKNRNTANGKEAARRAEELANEAVLKDATQALPHHTLGKLARDDSKNDKAVTEFREAARLDSNNYLYSHDFGRSLFITKRYQEACDAFQNAVKKNPNYEPAWYNLGGTLRILNRNDEALSAYKQAVAVKADYAPAHREIGRILSAKGDTKGAIDAFNKALQYSPNDLNTLCEIAAVHSQAGNFDPSRNLFLQRRYRLNPTMPKPTTIWRW